MSLIVLFSIGLCSASFGQADAVDQEWLSSQVQVMQGYVAKGDCDSAVGIGTHLSRAGIETPQTLTFMCVCHARQRRMDLAWLVWERLREVDSAGASSPIFAALGVLEYPEARKALRSQHEQAVRDYLEANPNTRYQKELVFRAEDLRIRDLARRGDESEMRLFLDQHPQHESAWRVQRALERTRDAAFDGKISTKLVAHDVDTGERWNDGYTSHYVHKIWGSDPVLESTNHAGYREWWVRTCHVEVEVRNRGPQTADVVVELYFSSDTAAWLEVEALRPGEARIVSWDAPSSPSKDVAYKPRVEASVTWSSPSGG